MPHAPHSATPESGPELAAAEQGLIEVPVDRRSAFRVLVRFRRQALAVAGDGVPLAGDLDRGENVADAAGVFELARTS